MALARTAHPALALFLILFTTCFAGSAGAALSHEDCADCHTGSGGDPAEVSLASLASSVHSGFDCADCHSGIEEIPHAEKLPRVACGNCHADIADIYIQHGRGEVGSSDAIPTCTSCHGTHDIRSHGDKKSPTHPGNLPATCGICHEDEELTEEQKIRFKHPVRVFSNSVHGRAVVGGLYSAATCTDCHTTDNTAHLILPAGDTRSPINHFNIPKTCGTCHKYLTEDYWEGIHGVLTERGRVDSPVCTTCHGEHNILRTQDPRSPVSPHRLAEATCTPCHESAALNEKYELPTGRLVSFRDSYHGLKSKAGDTTVANCASCHGAHRILPSSDPSSMIHPSNLQHTCGGCHPGITEAIAQTPIHHPSTMMETGAASIVRRIYILLIVVVIGGMILHVIIDFRRSLIDTMRTKKQVRRMDLDEVVQHFVLMLSFITLVITGFSLRFYDAWWAKRIFAWDGGFSFRGTVHRFAGVVMLIGAVWHLIYLTSPRGKRFLKDIMPKRSDIAEFWQNIRCKLDPSQEHPLFGRFSYVEKAEYWALVWGTAIMGITGLLLWLENTASRWISPAFLDVMLVIHYYEAWLAFLAILVWHMYATVFNPKVYPMNPSWLTGTMPEEQFHHEHPGAEAVPVLPANGDRKTAGGGSK